MFAKFFDRFKKDVWAHVGTLEHKVMISSEIAITGRDRGATIYVHLYESSKGNRRYELGFSDSAFTKKQVAEFFITTDTYNNRVCRWLAGRLDPEIPRFDQLGEEDTANMLKGKL